MTHWNALNSRERPAGLAAATRRYTRPGVVHYSFVHDDLEIDDPSLDATGRHFVSPREYGFSIRGFEDGKTAWARDFANGTMLVVNAEGQSHVLSPKSPARIVFVDPDGVVLQDSGQVVRLAHRVPDLATIRLTLTATVDLHGESPEAARALLMRLVDHAIASAAKPGESELTVLEHVFDGSAVLSGETPSSGETDFSQLLGA